MSDTLHQPKPPTKAKTQDHFSSSVVDSTFDNKSNTFFFGYDHNGPVILKIRLLNTALEMLKVEKQDKEKEREQVISERGPLLKLSGLSVQELQHLCRDLHHKIDVIDEERYDTAFKVSKNDKEVLKTE
ncbi:hypothetical protein cypCar_00001428 [Cyprinus carpio]|nr:hypothetical protein cypCar_00001428 [Cyprinus carpio]